MTENIIEIKNLTKKFKSFTANEFFNNAHIFSGALFPLNDLPKAISIIAAIDPLSYGIDGLRGTLVNASHYGFTIDILALSAVALILLGLGTYLFNKIQV